MTKLPLHRLGQFIRLERGDAETLRHLATEQRRFRRHGVIRAQGQPASEVYLLLEGWVACRVNSGSGGQIVKVHLPGDLLGMPSLALTSAAESLVGVSRGLVEVIAADAIAELFATSPRLAAAMFLIAQQERIFLMDRLTSIGRTSSVQRLAAFLVSIHERLSQIDHEAPPRFELPLSQQQLADVLGITTVHANRTLSQLQVTKLISRSGRWITIEDPAALRSFGCVPERDFSQAEPWVQRLSEAPQVAIA